MTTDDLRDPPGPKWIATVYWNGWPHNPTLGDLYVSARTRIVQADVTHVVTDFKGNKVRTEAVLEEFEEHYFILYLIAEHDNIQIPYTKEGIEELERNGIEVPEDLKASIHRVEREGWPREDIVPF